MATYGGTVTQIIQELARADTSITSFVEQEVLNAIEHYETTHFWFNEGTYTFTTSSSLANYAWPADMLAVDAVRLSVPGSNYILEPKNYLEVNRLDSGRDFSDPVMYAMYNQNFRLYPVPARSLTVAVDYQKRLATLSASTDSNAWTTVAGELIRSRVKAVLCAERFKDYEAAQVHHTVEMAALDRLQLHSMKLLGSGRITPSD